MTAEDRQLLERINKYSESVLGNIDPQKTPISMQLEQLKPIMEEIAKERGVDVTDIFILYMDLASEASVASNDKLKESLKDIF